MYILYSWFSNGSWGIFYWIFLIVDWIEFCVCLVYKMFVGNLFIETFFPARCNKNRQNFGTSVTVKIPWNLPLFCSYANTEPNHLWTRWIAEILLCYGTFPTVSESIRILCIYGNKMELKFISHSIRGISMKIYMFSLVGLSSFLIEHRAQIPFSRSFSSYERESKN